MLYASVYVNTVEALLYFTKLASPENSFFDLKSSSMQESN